MQASKCHQSDTVEFESYIPSRRSITLHQCFSETFEVFHRNSQTSQQQENLGD